MLLAVEVAAYFQGWHLRMPEMPEMPEGFSAEDGLVAIDGLFAAAYAGWMRVRLQYIATHALLSGGYPSGPGYPAGGGSGGDLDPTTGSGAGRGGGSQGRVRG